MSRAWASELEAIVRRLTEDDKVRAILVWAEGRMFTAGIDIKDLDMGNAEDMSAAEKSSTFLKTLRKFQAPLTLINKSKKPVIAAVHGNCIGGGVDLITACDIRVCTADATFSVKETKVAIVADLGTIPRITRIIGKGIYSEMVYTGEAIDADRALACGLVNKVYKTKEDLLAGARQLASKIAQNSPLVVQGAKTVIQFAEEHSYDDTLDYVALWNAAFLDSQDLKEAMMAFFQKRTPVFKNKL
uniref:Enoyl-CoA hydratase n=1 Tax=Arcella intermedia TaxID=1963864 RepID=A0A6B2LEE9_9EUKA